MEGEGVVRLSEIPQALADVKMRIAAAEELIAALQEDIARHQRVLVVLRDDYRRAVVRLAHQYLERLDS